MKRSCHLLRLLPIFVLALMSPYCYGETLGEGYGVSENCIVATPIGYEKNITLSNGVVVKLYPDMLSFARELVAALKEKDAYSLRERYPILKQASSEEPGREVVNEGKPNSEVSNSWVLNNNPSGEPELSSEVCPEAI